MLFGIAAVSAPDAARWTLYCPCRHVAHPLPNSLAPSTTRQVNTAGVSSLAHTPPHPPPQLSIPRGQPRGYCSTEAGPTPQDGPRGDFWSPWPHSPAASILPAAFPASQAHAPWRSPALHPGNDFGYPQLLEHLDLLLQVAGWSLGSHQYPDLMCKSAAGKRQTALSTINSAGPLQGPAGQHPVGDMATLPLILGPWAGLQEPARRPLHEGDNGVA